MTVDRSDGVLILTPFEPGDAQAVLEADRDAEHRRRFEIPADFVPSIEHAERVVERWSRDFEAGTSYAFAARHLASGELVGGCEVRRLGDATGNLSYWTYPAHRGQGYATRAARIAVAFAYAELDLRRIELVTDLDNAASRRIASTLGFVERGERDRQVLHVLERAVGPEVRDR